MSTRSRVLSHPRLPLPPDLSALDVHFTSQVTIRPENGPVVVYNYQDSAMLQAGLDSPPRPVLVEGAAVFADQCDPPNKFALPIVRHCVADDDADHLLPSGARLHTQQPTTMLVLPSQLTPEVR